MAALAALIQLRGLRIAEEEAAASAQSLASSAVLQADHARAAAEHASTAAVQAANEVQIARAQLLLSIDTAFESELMLESRLAFRTLRNRATKAAAKELGDTNETKWEPKAKANFTEYVNKLWIEFRTADPGDPDLFKTKASDRLEDAAGHQYQKLVRLLGWLETVGHLALENLLPREDIINLYDAVFISQIDWFKDHIEYRRQERPSPNSDWMIQAQKFRETLKAPTKAVKATARKQSKGPFRTTPAPSDR